MIRQASVVLLGLLLAPPVLAAPAKKAAESAAATEAAAEAATPMTQTDIIGSKEAPSVFNIVPWKDKSAAIPQKEVSTSILRETLQPLDRDVLQRQIDLQKALSTQ